MQAITATSFRPANTTSDDLESAPERRASSRPEDPRNLPLRARGSPGVDVVPRPTAAANTAMVVHCNQATTEARNKFVNFPILEPHIPPAVFSLLALAKAGSIDINQTEDRLQFTEMLYLVFDYAATARDYICKQLRASPNKNEISQKLFGPVAGLLLDSLEVLKPTPVIYRPQDAVAPNEQESSASFIANILENYVETLEVVEDAERQSKISDRADLVSLNFRQSQLAETSVDLAMKHGVEPILRLIATTAALAGQQAQKHLRVTLDRLRSRADPLPVASNAFQSPEKTTSEVLLAAAQSANKAHKQGFLDYLGKISEPVLKERGMDLQSVPQLLAILPKNPTLAAVSE